LPLHLHTIHCVQLFCLFCTCHLPASCLLLLHCLPAAPPYCPAHILLPPACLPACLPPHPPASCYPPGSTAVGFLLPGLDPTHPGFCLHCLPHYTLPAFLPCLLPTALPALPHCHCLHRGLPATAPALHCRVTCLPTGQHLFTTYMLPPATLPLPLLPATTPPHTTTAHHHCLPAPHHHRHLPWFGHGSCLLPPAYRRYCYLLCPCCLLSRCYRLLLPAWFGGLAGHGMAGFGRGSTLLLTTCYCHYLPAAPAGSWVHTATTFCLPGFSFCLVHSTLLLYYLGWILHTPTPACLLPPPATPTITAGSSSPALPHCHHCTWVGWFSPACHHTYLTDGGSSSAWYGPGQQDLHLPACLPACLPHCTPATCLPPGSTCTATTTACCTTTCLPACLGSPLPALHCHHAPPCHRFTTHLPTTATTCTRWFVPPGLDLLTAWLLRFGWSGARWVMRNSHHLGALGGCALHACHTAWVACAAFPPPHHHHHG